MKRFVVGLVALAALVGPVVGAGPAQADHTETLCNNEPSDIALVDQPPAPYVGTDLNTQGEVYLCVDHYLLVVRSNGPITICTYYTYNGTSTDDICPITQP